MKDQPQTSEYIAIKICGEVDIHLPSAGPGDWITLCGLDGHDEHYVARQKIVRVPPGARVNCPQCKVIWETAMEFTGEDFEK